MNHPEPAPAIVCVGPREWGDRAPITAMMHRVHAWNPRAVIVSGGAPGADRMWTAAARAEGLTVRVIKAEWKRCYCGRDCVRRGADHCPAAGFARNEQLVSAPHVIGVLACTPDGQFRSPGTADTVQLARWLSIPVWPVLGAPPAPVPAQPSIPFRAPEGTVLHRNAIHSQADLEAYAARVAEAAASAAARRARAESAEHRAALRAALHPPTVTAKQNPGAWYCEGCAQLVTRGRKCREGFTRSHTVDEAAEARSIRSLARDLAHGEANWWAEEGIDSQNQPDRLPSQLRLSSEKLLEDHRVTPAAAAAAILFEQPEAIDVAHHGDGKVSVTSYGRGCGYSHSTRNQRLHLTTGQREQL